MSLIILKSYMLGFLFSGFLTYAYSVFLKACSNNEVLHRDTKQDILLVVLSLGVPPLFCLLEAFLHSTALSFIGVSYGYLLFIIFLNIKMRGKELIRYLAILLIFSLTVNGLIAMLNLSNMLFFPLFNICILLMLAQSFHRLKFHNYIFFIIVAFVVINTNIIGIPLYLGLMGLTFYYKSYITLVFIVGLGFFIIAIRNILDYKTGYRRL